MAQYLSYETYQDYGGTLDETTFDDLAFEAQTLIDWYTFNRLQNEDSYPEAVQRCMYKIIKLLQEKMLAMALPLSTGEVSGNSVAGIVSQSNDGVSISYNTRSAREVIDDSKKEISSYISHYLQGVMNSLGQKVLYKGLYPGE